MATLILQKLKAVPETWLICLTVLTLPIATGLGIKIGKTEFISFSRGDTQIELGEVVKESDRLIEKLADKNQQLLENNSKLQSVIEQKNLKVPSLNNSDLIIKDSENITEELKANSEKIIELTSEEIK